MALAPTPPAPLPRRDAAVFSAAGQSRALPVRVFLYGRSLGRAHCVFSSARSGRRKQEESRRVPGSALGLSKAGFEEWGMETDTRRQRGQRAGPCPAYGGGGGRSGGVGGGGGWFRWFSSGGFWDAAKQTVLTILGIIAAFFLIANFNVLLAAALYPLLLVLRQIRRVITFAAYCVSRGMKAPASRPKPTPAPVGSSEPAAAPAKGRDGMSVKERVVSKWGSD